LLIPEVQESGYGIVPTSSTTAQLSLGDALAIASMQRKKFGKLDFKKFHPSGSLGNKLKTAEDLMLIKNKIPFINENVIMKNAIKIINSKKLGVLISKNSNGITTGILTDGDIKRLMQKNKDISNLKVKSIVTKNPITIEKNILAIKALSIMNDNKITSLCVHDKKNKKRTIGILHIHNLLDSNIQ